MSEVPPNPNGSNPDHTDELIADPVAAPHTDSVPHNESPQVDVPAVESTAAAVAPPEPTQASSTMSPPTEPAPSYARAIGAGASEEEKNQAMLCWFLSIIAGFVPPLIFFLIATDKPFVKRHAGMALGFMVVLAIAWIIAIILSAVLIGLLLIPIIVIGAIAICVMGGLAAKDGKEYEVPVVGPFIRKTLNI